MTDWKIGDRAVRVKDPNKYCHWDFVRWYYGDSVTFPEHGPIYTVREVRIRPPDIKDIDLDSLLLFEEIHNPNVHIHGVEIGEPGFPDIIFRKITSVDDFEQLKKEDPIYDSRHIREDEKLLQS